ncbi:cellulose synthase-like protein G3 isoform X1 [Humulus lupulus]|uniref:cellulose synthase-like protein G3 isoform X1 n=1 Tax=Humulus lupulus TaxID=3486 RepID=UPI002B40EDE5|nr:cellulose synthase-like protein G3 isoform X1 [Humulus lupulus]
MEALRRRLSTTGAPPLHKAELSRLTIPNRIFAAVYASAVVTLLYHHAVTLASLLFHYSTSTKISSLFISTAFLISDVVLAVVWTTTQSFRMRPIHREEFPEKINTLLNDKECEEEFPAIDVFVCTADPYKEPPMNVVNTVLSVMAYDYPAGKVSVYVSDDGGSALTLFAFVEAAKFAAHWLPFCRENDVVDRCPEAYFASANLSSSSDIERIKIMYESMKVRVENVIEMGKVGDENIIGEEEHQAFNKWTGEFTRQDHPTVIQVILHKSKNKDITGHVMPNLIYVAREKRRTSIHNFKAGALNALIRVSATMTNSPIILTLDCDTYSNDPQTPMRVLCYFLDPKIEPQIGYIQFPQRFHGINKSDTYACEFKRLFTINPFGMDGLLGPNYVGTGCFFKRRAFFGGPSNLVLPEMIEIGPDNVVNKSIQSKQVLDMAHFVAGCNYEYQTQWGYKVGVRYGSLVEDFFTSYHLQCEGWKGIFCNPKRAAFYGDSPITLIDVLTQHKRWAIGLLEVLFSKYCPIIFGTRFMGLIMGFAYSHNSLWPIWSIPGVIYAFLPQLALINGVSVFPKVSEPLFILYIFLFMGAYGQDLLDFIIDEGTFQRWWNDQRMWMIKTLTCFLFGSIEYSLKSLGISSHNFNVTSKVIDFEQSKRYEQGVFEFGLHSPMFVTLTMAAMTNLVALVWGLKLTFLGDKSAFDELFMQVIIAAFVVVNCKPIYGAILLRSSSKGGIPTKTTLLSMLLASSFFLLAFFSFTI